MTLSLKIFDSDSQKLSDLKGALSDLQPVAFQLVDTMLYLKPPAGIDVLYLPLAAAERFGSKPLIHESQVLPTSSKDQENGLPAFVVTGTCLAKGDPRGPVPEMRILLSAVFNAIRAFNRRGERKLEIVGFWSYNLLPEITPAQLKDILVELVPELHSKGGSSPHSHN
jgi:hypothetical protein